MAGAPPGMELCPYCRKPFKRLKSHLPYCKMAGGMKAAFNLDKMASLDLKASQSKPVRLLATEKKRGQSKEKITTPDNSSERESKKKSLYTIGNKVESKLNSLQIGGTAGSEIASNLPAEKPGKNTKRQIKLTSEKTHRDEGMTIVQEEARMHMNAAEERTSKAKHAKQLPTKQKSRSKNTSHDENSAPGGILELSSLNKDGKSASKFPNDPIRSAKQKQRKVGSSTQEVAGSLDLPTCDLESIPRAAIEGVKVVIENHRVKVLRGRRDSELALKQHLCYTSENQPPCLFQSSGRNIQARSIGLEWFPELYPNYQRLSMFPGRLLQGDAAIKMKKIEPGFLEGPQAPLVERRLMEVKLRDLPAWLAACDFSPKGLLGAVQKAWSSYYNKYIDVKKSGAAGISMLLAGYCILSYGWRYEHLKQDRWRRYH
ncbi:uncharacterized protein C17orf80 homolog isoform X2 [Terrapene carolina triunguis]|uniref:uncharacterized protein C17orf80 homolog isoform X2 n=1 Tax=Terrapene triunguis TaxID=2587831 RepID=UPI000CEFB47F|nr:uncharacterized protein C17orf80 homolog isoform X2 [Terrapene carolina triunguis]